jgi:hypothetical protein
LIFEKGCYHITLQDILNRTGLSKGVMTQGYEKKRYSDVLKQISPAAWQHINLYELKKRRHNLPPSSPIWMKTLAENAYICDEK